jgi:thioesterase domain-containing protein
LDDPGGGWQKYAGGGIEIHEVDGDHGNILNEPQVRQLAAKIRARVDQSQAAWMEESATLSSR